MELLYKLILHDFGNCIIFGCKRFIKIINQFLIQIFSSTATKAVTVNVSCSSQFSRNLIYSRTNKNHFDFFRLIPINLFLISWAKIAYFVIFKFVHQINFFKRDRMDDWYFASLYHVHRSGVKSRLWPFISNGWDKWGPSILGN